MVENNFTGTGAIIQWIWSGGTVALDGDYRSLSISESVNTADTSGGHDTKKTQVATLGSATIEYSGLLPSGAAGTLIVGALAAGNSGTLKVYPEGTLAGNLARTYPAIVMGPKINVPYNDIVEISCTFTSNGAWS